MRKLKLGLILKLALMLRVGNCARITAIADETDGIYDQGTTVKYTGSMTQFKNASSVSISSKKKTLTMGIAHA